MTEVELLQRIKQDPSEFSLLFKQYYKPIFGYILRRTGDIDDTADIAADTFLKAYRHIHHFSYKGISVKVWLYRIATNEVNRYFRNRQKYMTVFDSLDLKNKVRLFEAYQNDREILERELQQHEQFLSILVILKTLPLKYQEVISLRYFEGKENKEIVEILGIKEGTLKSLLSRGIDKLKEKCNQK